ncbi:MAG TPA: tetratricopeptide repeat protein [Phycisphaerae bacterium]|nr:tetratricopeptide repeat protein [Phycisphaerae bacterium]
MPASERNQYQLLLKQGWEALQAGRPAEAEALYRRVLELRPRTYEALHLLGQLCARTGRLDEAVDLIQKSLAIQPYNTAALEDLGGALLRLGRMDEAEDIFRRVLALRPAHAGSYFNLAVTLQRQGFIGQAIPLLRKALEINPSMLEAAFCLGGSLNESGQEDEGIAMFRRVVDNRPQDVPAHSNLLFAMLYHSRPDEAAILQEHQRWARRHADPLAQFIRPHDNDPSPDRPLRVGYLSSDFWEHAVSFFFEGLLENHDPARVETFCYADLWKQDAVTERLRAKAAHWRDIRNQSDEAIAAIIRNDKIDILVDLAGHSTGHHLLLFARKPAPIQVSYIGYPATTGLSTIDYRITDALVDPPPPAPGHTDPFFTERLVRLDRPFLCYRPPDPAPPVSPLPADSGGGAITFCSFNALAKIRRPTVEMWGRTLAAVPHSRMMIKAPRLRDDITRAAMRSWFNGVGISDDRIEFLPGTDTYLDHLAVYHRADIALDTFPYHGTTTTCEALWMGIPVISLIGKAHRSRVGLDLLSAVGLSEFAAPTPDQFVAAAAALAADLPRLRTLRTTMRDRLRASPLLDCKSLAAAVESAFRTMWRAWCYLQRA